MPKPNELFVGVLEFFAVLLPGAALTAILLPSLSRYILGPLVTAPTSELGIAASFLAASYFLGHFAFLIGAYIDPLYDRLRKKLNSYGNVSAYHAATLIRNEFLAEHEQKSINTFQWCRSVLTIVCPAAAEDIHRVEADSKFFRSVIVVCVIAAFVFALRDKYLEAVVTLGLLAPCFARYYERRLKSTTQAYIHIVSLNRLGKLKPASSNPSGAA